MDGIKRPKSDPSYLTRFGWRTDLRLSSSFTLLGLLMGAAALAAPRAETCAPTETCITTGVATKGDAGGFIIGQAWGGFPVQFAVVKRGQYQFAAYYNAARRLVVTRRDVRTNDIVSATLPTTLRWDSHNGIAMDIDSAGRVHVLANMHDSPLTYFRTTKPGDLTTMKRIPSLTGVAENSITYPTFLEGTGKNLILSYRNGKSGSGDLRLKSYNPTSESWADLTPRGLISGEGERSAYPTDVTKGPDGRYHIAWVWRGSPDAATNFNPSYAYSDDLITWKSAGGKRLKLPITLKTADIIDRVPPGGGILNGLLAVGFDADKHAVVSYHRYDANNRSQIFNARFEGGKWRTRAISNWDFKWSFGGNGSFAFAIGVEPVVFDGRRLTQKYRRPGEVGQWIVSNPSLQQVGQLPAINYSSDITKVRSKFSQMQTKIIKERGDSGTSMLRWESRTWNRDRPNAAPYPTSPLEIYDND